VAKCRAAQGRPRFLLCDHAAPGGPQIRNPKSERRPNQNGRKLGLTAEYRKGKKQQITAKYAKGG
jgi:hypothetical protein